METQRRYFVRVEGARLLNPKLTKSSLWVKFKDLKVLCVFVRTEVYVSVIRGTWTHALLLCLTQEPSRQRPYLSTSGDLRRPDHRGHPVSCVPVVRLLPAVCHATFAIKKCLCVHVGGSTL